MEKENIVKGLTEFITKYNIKTRIIDSEKYLVMYKAVRLDFGSWFHYYMKGMKSQLTKLIYMVECRHN